MTQPLHFHNHALSAPQDMANGAATKRGARTAKGDVLVFIDADGQHDLAHIPALLEQLDRSHDMAAGARDAAGRPMSTADSPTRSTTGSLAG
jgi:glycosyltransferase involved in cell wall biosynthesis